MQASSSPIPVAYDQGAAYTFDETAEDTDFHRDFGFHDVAIDRIKIEKVEHNSMTNRINNIPFTMLEGPFS